MSKTKLNELGKTKNLSFYEYENEVYTHDIDESNLNIIKEMVRE
jgi:hypothetical protein